MVFKSVFKGLNVKAGGTYIYHFALNGRTLTYATFVHFQLGAQNSCLFTYNTFIKILYMFRALPCSSSGGLRRNYIYAPSGIVIIGISVLLV